MFLDQIAGLPRHLLEEFRQITAFELHSRPTSTTNQMVSMSLPYTGMPMTATLCVDAPHKAKLRQQVQRAVDGHMPNARILLSSALANLRWAGESFVLEQSPNDGTSRLCDAVSGIS
jgi:hypothetical protein